MTTISEYPKYMFDKDKKPVLVKDAEEEERGRKLGLTEPPSTDPTHVLAQALRPQLSDFPMMLFKRSADGQVSNVTVNNQAEADERLADGWHDHPSGKPAAPATPRVSRAMRSVTVTEDAPPLENIDDDDEVGDQSTQQEESVDEGQPIAPFTPPPTKPTKPAKAPKAPKAPKPVKGSK